MIALSFKTGSRINSMAAFRMLQGHKLLLSMVVACLFLSCLMIGSVFAAGDPSNMSDENFFGEWDAASSAWITEGKIDYSYSAGLAAVEAEVKAGDYSGAKQELMNYYRNRTTINTFDLTDAYWETSYEDDIQAVLDHVFTYKGETDYVDEPDINGDPVWDNPDGFYSDWYKLLVRFDYLLSVIRHHESSSTPDDQDLQNMVDFISDYIVDKGNANPGYGLALQGAIRLHNFTMAYPYLIESSLADTEQMGGFLKHIWQLADYTRAPNQFLGIDNNRGLIQANSLYTASVYFPEFADASDWEEYAIEKSNQYVPFNIYENGALGEAAIKYHTSQIMYFYEIEEIAASNGKTVFDSNNSAVIQDMFSYYIDYSYPNDTTPLIGDSYVGASKFEVMNNIADRFGREDVQYVTSEGVSGVSPHHQSKLYDHGAAIMRTGWQPNDLVAFIENQPLNSHSHPDNLSINLYGYDHYLLTNSGTHNYDYGDLMSNWHRKETEASSTVQIDSRPQISFGEKINKWVDQFGYTYYAGEYRDAYPHYVVPSDDTYIRGGVQSDVNYAKDELLRIRNGTSNGSDRMVYLKFRIGNVSEALDMIKLHLYHDADIISTTAIKLYGLDEDAWVERGITWSEQSSNHDSGDTVISGTGYTLLDTINFLDEGWYVLDADVNSAFRTFIESQAAGDGIVTLALLNETDLQTESVLIHSKENSNQPYLEFTVNNNETFNDVLRHERKVFFDQSDLFVVSDRLSGAEYTHQYEQLWNLDATNTMVTGYPTMDSSTKKASALYKNDLGQGDTWLQIASADTTALSFVGMKDGFVSKFDNNPEANKRIVYEQEKSGMVTFDTVLLAGNGGSAQMSDLQVSRLALSDSAQPDTATALKIELDQTSSGDILHYYLSHERQPALRGFGGFTYDGELAAIRKKSNGEMVTIQLQEGKQLSEGSIDWVSSQQIIPDLTIDYTTAGTLKLSSSEELGQTIIIYSPDPVTSVETNGQPVSFTAAGDYYTISRTTLWQDDFDQGTARKWIQDSGLWSINRVVHDYVLVNDTASANQVISTGYTDWQDIQWEARVAMKNVDSSTGEIGVLARYKDKDNYYGFVYNVASEQFEIYKNVNGTRTTLGTPVGFKMHLSGEYRFKAVVEQSDLYFYVNDVLHMTTSDSSITEGKVGLIADELYAAFDEVKVTSETETSVYLKSNAVDMEIVASENGYVSDSGIYANMNSHFWSPDRAKLNVRDGNVGEHMIAYVSFDLMGYPGQYASTVELKLSGYSEDGTSQSVEVYGIENMEMNDRQMTWINSPNHAIDDAELAGSGYTYLGSIQIDEPETYTIDVTSYLNNIFQERKAGFMLISRSEGGVKVEIDSTVYVKKPRLRIANAFEPTEDAYVRSGTNSQTNYGSNDRLSVRDWDNNLNVNNDMIGYLKFDLSAFPYQAVTDSTFYFYGGTDDGSSVSIDVYGLTDDSWNENSITWELSPNHDPDNSSVTGTGYTFLGTVVVSQPGWYTVDGTLMSEFLAGQVADDGIATLQLIDQAEGGKVVLIDSSEGLHKPYVTMQAPYVAVEDARVSGGSNADSNYGTADRLVVRDDDTDLSKDFISYAKFNLSNHLNGNFDSSVLAFYAYQLTYDVPVKIYGLTDDSWNENEITWNSSPNHSQTDTDPAGTGYTYLGEVTVNDEKWYELTGSALDNYLSEQWQSDGVGTLMFLNNQQGYHVNIHSKENTSGNRMYLKVNQ